MYLIKEWLCQFWDWFWIYRRGKVKIRVLKFRDSYQVMASDGNTTVWHCHGSMPKVAKEIALFRLRQAYEGTE